MENIALGFVLFCVYFCAVSCFFYSSKGGSVATKTNSDPIEKQIKEMFRMIDTSEESIEVSSVKESDVDSIEPEKDLTILETESKQIVISDSEAIDYVSDELTEEPIQELNAKEKYIEALNLDKLTLRKARPVARVVNVGQNTSVKNLRERIRQKLQEEPELIPAVFKVLEVPFPNADRIDTHSA